MPNTAKPTLATIAMTLLRFILLNSLLVVPAVLLWQSSGAPIDIWPVLETDRGWYSMILSAVVRRPALDMLMFYGDVPLLFVLVIAATRLGLSRSAAAWLGGLGFLVLLLFQVYHQLSWWLQHQPPMFVADLPLIQAGQHFLADLGPKWQLGTLAAGLGGGVVVLLWSRRLLRGLIRDSGHSFAPYLVSLGLVAYAAALMIMVGAQRNDTVGKWLAKELYSNVTRSMAHLDLSEQLEGMASDDRYLRMLNRPIQRSPNVLVYLMESYGGILLSDARYRGEFSARLRQVENSLVSEGWHMAHNLSSAPVHGGKSWFSSASILTGVKIAYPSHYQHFQAMGGDYPHLVRWLAAKGYQTTGVWPATKKRVGLSNDNTYDFDRYLTSEQIPYQGRAYGWAGTPDQFSLGYAVDRVTRNSSGLAPHFMFYVSASSHSPWRMTPPLAKRWQDAGATIAAGAEPAKVGHKEHVLNALNNRLRRSFIRQDLGKHYVDHIGYQWDVLRQLALSETNPFDLIIVVGDHQPPLLQGDHEPSFQTPIHILARERSIVDTALAGGFASSTSSIMAAKPIRHEGIYQLIADLLGGVTPEVASQPWREGASLGAFKL